MWISLCLASARRLGEMWPQVGHICGPCICSLRCLASIALFLYLWFEIKANGITKERKFLRIFWLTIACKCRTALLPPLEHRVWCGSGFYTKTCWWRICHTCHRWLDRHVSAGLSYADPIAWQESLCRIVGTAFSCAERQDGCRAPLGLHSSQRIWRTYIWTLQLRAFVSCAGTKRLA